MQADGDRQNVQDHVRLLQRMQDLLQDHYS